jgi:hypothetical protein
LRVNSNKTPSKQLLGLRVAPSKSSDKIYEYIKTLSKYRKRKNGLLINQNQHIVYNFNSKNLLLRGAEPLINNSLKTNKNNSTNAVPFTFQLEKAKVAKATEKINKNININYPLKKLLVDLYPDFNKNTPRPSVANTQRTEEPKAPTIVKRETAQDLLLRLNR